MKFEPFHHFVHIKKVVLKELQKSGSVFIPDTVQDKAAVFEVIAAGPGFFDVNTGGRVPMSVNKGDMVLVDVNQLVNASYCGREMLICPETAIYGRVEFAKSS